MAWPPQDNTLGGDEVKSAAVPNLRRCRSSSGYNFALSETSPSDHAIAAIGWLVARTIALRRMSRSVAIMPQTGPRRAIVDDLGGPARGISRKSHTFQSAQGRDRHLIPYQARDAIAPDRPLCANTGHS